MDILSYLSFTQLLDEVRECRVWMQASQSFFSAVRVTRVNDVYVIVFHRLGAEGNVEEEIVTKRYTSFSAYREALRLVPVD